MIPAKNYETVFKCVKVMPRKLVASLFLDTVYSCPVGTRFNMFHNGATESKSNPAFSNL